MSIYDDTFNTGARRLFPSRLFPAVARSREEIDALSGLACLGVVLFHATAAGPQLAGDHWVPVINASLSHIRMPLFAFVSGYAFRSVAISAAEGSLRAAVLGRAGALLIPLATLGTLLWLLRGGVGPAWPGVLLLPYAHFWFLQALFLIMGSVLVLARVLGGRHDVAALLLGVGSALVWTGALGVPDVTLFAFAQAVLLAVFFCTGLLFAGGMHPPVRRTSRSPAAARLRLAGAVALAVSLNAATVLALAPALTLPALHNTLSLCIGLLGVVGLFLLRPRVGWLTGLGRHAFAIYLLHPFFLVGAALAVRAGLPGLSPELWLAVTLPAGIAGPILADRVLRRLPILRTLLLGSRPGS
ncbi:hypothetical protein GCM10011360_38000 [Primorskyibacter flagellatus]|uniref:Acyltransferase 3 domain-containing protein n=1 Tax=Primorskyibacter flagellatus TaxID=1387277 RepID=A0A917AFQ2_9RHOB|nr:acyltransferase [Primorskyibacter flagellatus]GGE47156.1 hypothetical protein GCM10011360_38000 [Primorskyibacter flagellatus]